MPDQTSDDIILDIRRLHSRVTDSEDIIELHSADIAAILECIAAISKRLSVCEKRLGVQCEGDEERDGTT